MSRYQRLVERALEIAEQQIGVRESGGPNRGGPIVVPFLPRIEQYLASVGLTAGNPYCVAGIYWCFAEAARELGEPNPMPRTGGALKLWELSPVWAKHEWQNSGDPTPARGSIFVHASLSKPGKGHVGFVLGASGLTLSTLEFNTDPSGGREGDGVYTRTREIEYVNVGIVDFGREVLPGEDDPTVSLRIT